MAWWIYVLIAVAVWIGTGLLMSGGNNYSNERMPYWWDRFGQ